MSSTQYSPPVSLLLALGEVATGSEWKDYAEHGLGPEHVPDLIRLATDMELNKAEMDRDEVWAPMHAWRCLGQLRAEQAVVPLLSLLRELSDDDWLHDDLSKVMSRIGPVAIPKLSETLEDKSLGWYPKAACGNSLARIASEHPEARAECTAALTEKLSRFMDNDPDLNACLVGR